MRGKAKIVLMLLFGAAVCAGAQSPIKGQGPAGETQAHEYWVDTYGLMWAGQDNGKDVNWHEATKYCHNLRLAGYSDWRLATIVELTGIYDQGAESAGETSPTRGHEAEAMKFHVNGNLFLTGNEWSSTRVNDDRGKPSGYAWYFTFTGGTFDKDDETWTSILKRALCVRKSGD